VISSVNDGVDGVDGVDVVDVVGITDVSGICLEYADAMPKKKRCPFGQRFLLGEWYTLGIIQFTHTAICKALVMTFASFFIQSIEPDDIPSWRRLRDSLWPHATAEEHEREIAEILSAPERYASFMAFSETKTALGFAEASIRHDYVNGCDTSPVLFLEGIYVTPEARRQGIAKALFKCVEQWGVSHACEEFASDTDIGNIGVQALHRALGFEETERVVFFKKRTTKTTSA